MKRIKSLLAVVKHLFKLLRYHFSRDRMELDKYMYKIRGLEPISDADWTQMRELATKEKAIYEFKEVN